MKPNNTRKNRRNQRTAATGMALFIANNPMGSMVLVSLFMLIVATAIWQANADGFSIKRGFFSQFKQPDISDAVRTELANRHLNNKFVMGGVQLGMAKDSVQSTHPQAQAGVDRRGQPVITIPTPNGIMVAWLFSKDEVTEVAGNVVRDDTQRVYRLRLDEAFAELSEQDVMTRYGREYGRPLEATCSRAGQGDTPRCSYRWWGGDGITLEAIAKKKVDRNGRVYTQLTTIATDTIRTATKPNIISLSQIPSRSVN